MPKCVHEGQIKGCYKKDAWGLNDYSSYWLTSFISKYDIALEEHLTFALWSVSKSTNPSAQGFDEASSAGLNMYTKSCWSIDWSHRHRVISHPLRVRSAESAELQPDPAASPAAARRMFGAGLDPDQPRRHLSTFTCWALTFCTRLAVQHAISVTLNLMSTCFCSHTLLIWGSSLYFGLLSYLLTRWSYTQTLTLVQFDASQYRWFEVCLWILRVYTVYTRRVMIYGLMVKVCRCLFDWQRQVVTQAECGRGQSITAQKHETNVNVMRNK